MSALIFADDRPTSCNDDLYQWAMDAEALIRNLHTENEALRAQIGQGVPDGVLDALDNFEKKERSPFQAYLAAGLVNELRTALLASAHTAPQQKLLTDEQIVDAYCKERGMRQYVEAYVAGARFAEAAHNIGEKK